MRIRGQFTQLQGRTLPERLTNRVGEDTETLTVPEMVPESAVRRPSPPLDGEYREDQDVVADPTWQDPTDIDRDIERAIRYPEDRT